MAGVTAHITSGAVTVASRFKGAAANLLGYKQILDPAGATGATSVSVSGLDITVKLKNDGTDPTATIGEVYLALSGSADTQNLATVVQAGDTGATGVAFTGSGGVFVRGASGADGTNGYDDLAAATGDGWTLTNLVPLGAQATAVDILTKIRNGRRYNVQAVAATGATNVVKSAHAAESRDFKMGTPRIMKAIGATGAGEYVL